MIQKRVDVLITREGNTITIDNKQGMTWKMELHNPEQIDLSTAAGVGHAFANMMASTIGSQIYHTNEKFYHFAILLSAYS